MIREPGDLPSFSHQPSGGMTEGRREVYACLPRASAIPAEAVNRIFSGHSPLPHQI
ncbi:hypothetical protein [Acetobacter lambici]|uniref:Uncharacterized protein n=1 Tax=Acetobacter lambici TaxID=1332824 RepID=A0ABT1F4R2_9PROT|nr:hypothetical protein [Acetobacter lambici]MCP1244299.1 hypothetical protein [Acetobacter lambici]MCP1260215.1 hypothetical protein [Acetobacter lambici]